MLAGQKRQLLLQEMTMKPKIGKICGPRIKLVKSDNLRKPDLPITTQQSMAALIKALRRYD